MKTKMKISILLLIMITSLLIFSCNTENDGVFERISKSQVKVDVGYVDIIGMNTTDIYAYTSEKALQKFTLSNGEWSLLDTTIPYQGLYAANVPTNVTELYYATRTTEDTNNDLYTFTILTGSEGLSPDNSYEIIEMKPHNLMLVKDGSNGYSVVRDISDGDPAVDFAAQFSTTLSPRLISQSNTNYVVSGIEYGSTVAYTHYFSGTNELTPTGVDTTFNDNPIIALLTDGTKIVLVDSLGKVWHNTNSYSDFTYTETIPGFPTDRQPPDVQYPTFIYNNELYLQNGSNEFYKIDIDGAVSEKLTSSFAEFLSGIRVKSYLEDGSTIYAGTMENGIVKIDILNDTAEIL